jgi:alpha,alpha-trehalase
VLAAVLQALDDAGVLDTSLRDAALPVLIAEWAFWTAPGTHGVRITASSSSGPREFRLSRYNANWTSPRPESWREDVATAAGLTTPGAKARVWRELATAAESGWDFSSRWCSPAAVAMAIQEGVDACDAHLLLRHTRCSRIVPADLNALLLILARCISKWARQVRDEPTGNAFAAHAQALAEAIHAVLWDPTGAQWRDFELTGFDDEGDIDSLATDNSSFIWTGRQSSREFASNWVPLWCGCLQPGSADALACCASLAASRLVQPGGIAASETATGQQWDWPNAWPPLQLLLAEGVARAGGPAGVALGKAMAGSYLRACVAGLAHQPVGAMHEKYDATVEATLDGGATCTRNAGGGGEYAPQVGFGWSNGVALAMLRTHGGIPDTTLSDVVAKMSK